MGFLKGRLTFRRYRVNDPLPDDFFQYRDRHMAKEKFSYDDMTKKGKAPSGRGLNQGLVWRGVKGSLARLSAGGGPCNQLPKPAG